MTRFENGLNSHIRHQLDDQDINTYQKLYYRSIGKNKLNVNTALTNSKRTVDDKGNSYEHSLTKKLFTNPLLA